MRKYSPEIAEAIKAHIKDNDLHMVSFDEELGSFSFNMHMNAQLSSINIIIRVGEDDFSAMAICPVRPDISDKALMANMAEFVCRANFGLKNGCFEFDFSDGELRYRCYVPCGGSVPSQDIIRKIVATPALMLRRYSAGIIGVLYNGMDPEDMVKACEDDSVGRRVYDEMKRSRREFLMRHLDRAAAAAESSGALPSFDEFVKAQGQPDADSGEPVKPGEPDSSGDNSNSGESDE